MCDGRRERRAERMRRWVDMVVLCGEVLVKLSWWSSFEVVVGVVAEVPVGRCFALYQTVYSESCTEIEIEGTSC